MQYRRASSNGLRSHHGQHGNTGLPDDLAADYGRACASWAESFGSPTLAGMAGTGPDAPTTKVAGHVLIQSPVGPVGGNALGYARAVAVTIEQSRAWADCEARLKAATAKAATSNLFMARSSG